jgi:hypothetical protein
MSSEQEKGDPFLMNPCRVWARQVRGEAESLKKGKDIEITVYPGDWIVTLPSGKKIAFKQEDFQRYFTSVQGGGESGNNLPGDNNGGGWIDDSPGIRI